MKILIIRNYPSYMAVNNNTYNIQEVGLAKALVRKGHTCDIVFWTDKQKETVTIPVDESGAVHVVYKHGKTALKNTIFTNCNDLFEQYNILQPCEYNQMQAWLLAKTYPEKTVIYHGPYYSPFNKRYNIMCRIFDFLFLRLYIRKGTKFLVKSDMAKKFLVRKGIREENVKTVGVGIDIQMLSFKGEECTEPLYINMKRSCEDELKLLYIGKFEERRDILFLIDIFKKVTEKNPNTRLYMIGTGDSEYLKQALTYMENLGIRDRIVWQEKMEQKYLSEVYREADFFLLPTEYEIFGMVLLEAMYYGNIVLTTCNGGSSTLISSGINGFILNNKDAEEWANCIIQTYGNKTQMKQIQKNATSEISEHFTWDALANKFIKQYEKKLRGE